MYELCCSVVLNLLFCVLRQSWRNPLFDFLEVCVCVEGGGRGDKVVFSSHVKIFANFCDSDPNFFCFKSTFVVQKKNDFDGKPKMTKISNFENVEIAKTGQITSFWRKALCGHMVCVNSFVVWFGLSFSFFLSPKCFVISKKTKRSHFNWFQKKKCFFFCLYKFLQTEEFYTSSFNMWISPGLS